MGQQQPGLSPSFLPAGAHSYLSVVGACLGGFHAPRMHRPTSDWTPGLTRLALPFSLAPLAGASAGSGLSLTSRALWIPGESLARGTHTQLSLRVRYLSALWGLIPSAPGLFQGSFPSTIVWFVSTLPSSRPRKTSNIMSNWRAAKARIWKEKEIRIPESELEGS